MAKSKLTNWGAASWLTRVTDHVTRSDQYDRHHGAGGDDRRRWQPRGDDGNPEEPRGDDRRPWVTIVWLGSLAFQFVIKGAVVHLNWGLSSVVAKKEVVNK